VDLPVFSVKAHNGFINAIDGCGGLGVGTQIPALLFPLPSSTIEKNLGLQKQIRAG
jgi:hypothetical protein